MNALPATRDEARAYFAAAGLTGPVIDADLLEDLRVKIDARLREAKTIKGYRMRKSMRIHNAPRHKWSELYCRAYYFKSREAVTFGADGFVGFAGWASDENVAPIIAAFVEWVDAVAAASTGARP